MRITIHLPGSTNNAANPNFAGIPHPANGGIGPPTQAESTPASPPTGFPHTPTLYYGLAHPNGAFHG